MEMTNKEFSSHFSDSFTEEIKSFGRETLLKEGFDCLIVTDKEDKEKAYCTHCKKWVKIPGDTIHTGSPKSIQAAERRRYNNRCCHGTWGLTEELIEMERAEKKRREAIEERKLAVCPECGFRFNVYHRWRMNMGQLDGTVSISVWAKSKVDPAAVVMRRIEIKRNYRNSEEPVIEDTYREAERYLFRMGHKTIRQNCRPLRHYEYDKKTGWKCIEAGRKKFFVKNIIDRAVRQSNVMWTDYIKGHYRMNIGSLKAAIRETPYYYLFKGENGYIRNFQSYEYRESYPLHTVRLMDLYSLHPWIEVLIKSGMDNIVMDHLRGEGCGGAICWGAKTLKSAVKRFTKQDLKNVMEYNRRIRDKASRINEEELSVLALAREHRYQQIAVGMARNIAREGYGRFESLVITAERIGLHGMKVLGYCQKEGGIGHAIGDWLDYIRDAEKVGLDLRDKSNSLPKDLKHRHANIIKQIKYRENKELEEKLKATLAVRNKIFCWKGKKYFIRPAESTKELIAEGKALHHCVGGYAERHAKGATTILLVRENGAPDKPLYTMEVKGSVKQGWDMVQIRGNMNSAPPKEVLKMVAQFMEKINNQGNERKVRKTA